MLGNTPSWINEFEALEQYFDHESAQTIISLLKKHQGVDFRKAMGRFLPRSFRLSLVTDASSLISVFMTEIKGKTSLLWELVKLDLIRCWAPARQLQRDLEGKFERWAVQLGRSKDDIKREWDTRIAPYVKLSVFEAPDEVKDRLRGIEERDPEDTEYLGLFLVMSADAILSKDGHILKEDSVPVWGFDKAIKIASIYRRGRLVTTIHAHGFTMMCVAVGILFAIVAGAYHLASWLIKHVPGWAWLAASTTVAGLLLFPKTRAWVIRLVEWIRQKVHDVRPQVQDALKHLYDFWGPILDHSRRVEEETRELVNKEPHLAKRRPRRRKSAYSTFSDQVVGCVRGATRPLRPSDIARKLYPLAASCDLAHVRRQITTMLSRRSDVRKVGRGLYVSVLAS